MNKTILITGIVLVVIVGGYFLYFSNRGTSTIEVAPETIKQLEKSTPLLSNDKESYFSLLEKSAISGGPPKDGIPSIDAPAYTNAKDADEWLLPEDIVFGIEYGGFIAAYPQRIVVWHEIVNVEVGGEDLAVTYCPLTGTAIGFKGEYAPGISSEFGVSGKLINSNLLMYDRKSDSYWPQILGTAITDPAKGIRLEEFSVVWTTWEKWKRMHPDTLVLSRDTSFFRNYGEGGDPYGSYLRENRGYYSSNRLLFDPINKDSRLHPKEVVVGIRDAEDQALAIVKDKLRAEKVIEAPLGDNTIVITYNQELDFYEARVKETGKWINAFDAMWFSWTAFYPDTELVQ